jgi:hypothetical protein
MTDTLTGTAAAIAARRAREVDAALATYRAAVGALAGGGELSKKQSQDLEAAMAVLGVGPAELAADGAVLRGRNATAEALAKLGTTDEISDRETAACQEVIRLEEEHARNLAAARERRRVAQGHVFTACTLSVNLDRIERANPRLFGAYVPPADRPPPEPAPAPRVAGDF